MSVSSSKTTVTTESPYFDSDRISLTLGVPESARSTGTVTYCSTSTGDSAGDEVMTCTWMLVTSGTASMGSSKEDLIPTATKTMVAATTMARLASDQRTMAARSATLLLLP